MKALAIKLTVFCTLGIILLAVSLYVSDHAVLLAHADSTVRLTIKYANDTLPTSVLSVNNDGKYTLSQPYSWVRDQTSRYNLEAYSVDNGPYVNIPRVARGNFTLDVPTDSNHEIVFMATTQYPIEIVGTDQVSFAPSSPTNDNWFDVNSDERISVPYVMPSDEKNTREQLKGWSYDGEDSKQIQRSESGLFSTPQILISNSHSVNFMYATQYYLDLVSEYGHATGSGWYDSGTTATLSSSPNDDFPVRHVFSGWNGQVLDPHKQTTSILMESPTIVTANWTVDYTPVVLMGAAAIGAGGIILYKKRRTMPSVQIMPAQPETLDIEKVEPSTNVQSTAPAGLVTDDTYSKEIDACIVEKSMERLGVFETSGILSKERHDRLKPKMSDGAAD